MDFDELASSSGPGPSCPSSGGGDSFLSSAPEPSSLHKRGRKLGVLKRLESHRCIGAPATESVGTVASAPESESGGQIVLGSSSRSVCDLATFLRPVGTDFQASLAQYLRNADVWTADIQQVPSKFIEHFWGEQPRATMPRNAEAEFLQTNRRSLGDQLTTLASVAHSCSRLFCASVSGHVRRLLSHGTWEGLSCFKLHMQDESAFKMRAPDESAKPVLLPISSQPEHSRVGDAADHGALVEQQQQQILSKGRKQPSKGFASQACKVFQSKCSRSYLLKQAGSHQYMFIHVPLSCPLFITEGGTAEVAKAVNERASQVPLWGSLGNSGDFKFVFRASNEDGASSNAKADKAESEATGLPSLHLDCDTHSLSNVQGRAYAMTPALVSGLIAFELSTQTLGAAASLRKVCARVLLRRARPQQRAPPKTGDPRIAYREAVLNLCLTSSTKDKIRRVQIEADLHSDLTRRDIIWYTLDAAPNMERWPERAARALIPSSLEVFNRNRWLSKTTAWREVSLLGLTHDLLDELGPAYIAELKGQKMPWEIRPKIVPRHLRPDAWEAEIKALQDEVKPEELSIDRSRKPNAGEDWAAFNERNRGDAFAFFQSRPTSTLVVSCRVLQTSIHLFQKLLSIGSEQWEEKQFGVALQTKSPILTRMQIAAELTLTDAFFAEAQATHCIGQYTSWFHNSQVQRRS